MWTRQASYRGQNMRFPSIARASGAGTLTLAILMAAGTASAATAPAAAEPKTEAKPPKTMMAMWWSSPVAACQKPRRASVRIR